MDYMFFSSLRGIDARRLVISYDIACQWSKNVWSQMDDRFPPSWAIDHTGATDITFLIPKFHLPAHIESCHNDFSWNLTNGVGQTDGEAPERGWSRTNPLATSMREMGPRARREVIDDHLGYNNWKKTASMG
jgi:hypothetical protein